jgi:hypothetical protein
VRIGVELPEAAGEAFAFLGRRRCSGCGEASSSDSVACSHLDFLRGGSADMACSSIALSTDPMQSGVVWKDPK